VSSRLRLIANLPLVGYTMGKNISKEDHAIFAADFHLPLT
jgi:hypothetical protein